MSLFTIQLARKGKPVEIQTRSLSTGFDDSESEIFTTISIVSAIVCTPNGKAVFDGVDTLEDVTHEFHMAWPGYDVTVEHWILFKSKRYRVLPSKNCCESDTRMIVMCTERGQIDREAASA